MPVIKKLLAVYGTLRRGGRINAALTNKKATFIRTTTIKGYKMYDQNTDHAYPIVVPGTQAETITVEIFRVGPNGMAATDRLEGYTVGSTDNKYVRKTVTAISGENVELYVWNRPIVRADTPIPSGDWFAYTGSIVPSASPTPAAVAPAPVPEAEAEAESPRATGDDIEDDDEDEEEEDVCIEEVDADAILHELLEAEDADPVAVVLKSFDPEFVKELIGEIVYAIDKVYNVKITTKTE